MVTGQYVRMKTTNRCRCSQCNTEFVPDPRIGERQVTCGAPECQRARHAEQCRAWHADNKESTSEHYQDVVRPFRAAQPDYQRRWRWGCRLREIREEMMTLGGAVLGELRSLVRRAERLVQGALGSVQSGVLAGEKLGRAVLTVRTVIDCIEQLQSSTAELRELGL